MKRSGEKEAERETQPKTEEQGETGPPTDSRLFVRTKGEAGRFSVEEVGTDGVPGTRSPERGRAIGARLLAHLLNLRVLRHLAPVAQVRVKADWGRVRA